MQMLSKNKDSGFYVSLFYDNKDYGTEQKGVLLLWGVCVLIMVPFSHVLGCKELYFLKDLVMEMYNTDESIWGRLEVCFGIFSNMLVNLLYQRRWENPPTTTKEMKFSKKRRKSDQTEYHGRHHLEKTQKRKEEVKDFSKSEPTQDILNDSVEEYKEVFSDSFIQEETKLLPEEIQKLQTCLKGSNFGICNDLSHVSKKEMVDNILSHFMQEIEIGRIITYNSVKAVQDKLLIDSTPYCKGVSVNRSGGLLPTITLVPGKGDGSYSDVDSLSKPSVETVICIHTAEGVDEMAFQGVKEIIVTLLGGLDDAARKYRLRFEDMRLLKVHKSVQTNLNSVIRFEELFSLSSTVMLYRMISEKGASFIIQQKFVINSN